jgi:hypothetical protein
MNEVKFQSHINIIFQHIVEIQFFFLKQRLK